MDAGLRQLEQAWRKSGSVEDEAAWLSARAAAGTLEPERLRFCALLGYPSARRALRAQGQEPPSPDARFEWAGAALDLGPEGPLRLPLAAARATLPVLRAAPAGQVRRALAERQRELADARGGPEVETRIPAAPWASFEAWLLDPSPAREAALRDDLQLLPALQSLEPDSPGLRYAIGCARATLEGVDAQAPLDCPDDDMSEAELAEWTRLRRSARLRTALTSALGALCDYALGEHEVEVTDELCRRLEAEQLTQTLLPALAAELSPWLLGYGDPVRLRVAQSEETELWPGGAEG
ncbi:MAG TPA: hypothetical protein DEA08_38115 [Planctomycetes bacterium]|nr:hypothetical protein [Planctomycetota bacterium]